MVSRRAAYRPLKTWSGRDSGAAPESSATVLCSSARLAIFRFEASGWSFLMRWASCAARRRAKPSSFEPRSAATVSAHERADRDHRVACCGTSRGGDARGLRFLTGQPLIQINGPIGIASHGACLRSTSVMFRRTQLRGIRRGCRRSTIFGSPCR